MTSGAPNIRLRKSKGPSTAPVVWHLQRQGERSFTIGVYPGVSELWNAKTNKWVQTATGYFAEIKERLDPKTQASATPRPIDRASETLYTTRDEAHTRALRRVRTIVIDADNLHDGAPQVESTPAPKAVAKRARAVKA